MLVTRRFGLAALSMAFGVEAAIAAAIVVFVGPHGWDDGAITLAYSRTFAETGRVALTSFSEQVEGFSTISWFLMNAFVAAFHPGFKGAILFSQLIAALFLAAGTLLIFLIARHLRLKESTIAAILLTFAMFSPSIAEISNGMEMTLFAASGIAIVYALYFEKHSLLLYFSTVIFLTTRFEAIIYFAFLLLPLLFLRELRKLASLAMIGLVITGIQEIARYLVFHDIVPNTIYAKTHYPYSDFVSLRHFLQTHAIASMEILIILLPLAIAIFVLSYYDLAQRLESLRALSAKRKAVTLLFAPILVAVLFSLAVSRNRGYVARMLFFFIPFALLLFGLLLEKYFVEFRAYDLAQIVGRLRALLVKQKAIFILLAPILAAVSFSLLTGPNRGYLGRMQFFAFPFAFLLFGIFFEKLVVTLDKKLAGAILIAISATTVFMSYQLSASTVMLLPARVMASVANGSRGATDVEEETPAFYRLRGLAVDRVRELTASKQLVLATQDVGGIGLCCNSNRIVDLGMLTNRRLAKEGYGALPSVLAEEMPDIVEVNFVWASFSKIYELPDFKENYQATLVGRQRLYLRSALVQKLLDRHNADWCQVKDTGCLTRVLGSFNSQDKHSNEVFMTNGKILIVCESGEVSNCLTK